VLAAAMLGFLAVGVDLAAVAINIYDLTDKQLLAALPFFTFAGYLMAEAKSSERLMALIRALFGWMPAGLAIVGFIACALFTALTGASGVTIVALGALLLPMLTSSGYRERYSLGLVTTSGSLGVLIVPSVPLILYGVVAQQMDVGEPFSIQQLFLGGLGPALLMVVLLSGWTIMFHGDVPRSRFDAGEVWRAVKAARWEIPLPFVVLGGIYSGYFVISEAAAMTAVYVLIAEVALYREVSLRALPRVVRESMVMVGSIVLILGVALAVVLLAAAAVQVGTGLFTTDDIFTEGPLHGYVSNELARTASWIHHRVHWLVLGAGVVHLAAHAVYALLRDPTPLSMFTGRKQLELPATAHFWVRAAVTSVFAAGVALAVTYAERLF